MHDGHDHAHGSAHGETNATDKSKLLLRFTLDHNTQHVAEAKSLAEKLESESRFEAAALLRESIALYEAGNEKIHAALDKL
ncbi:hypothetical protein AGMMS49983_19880 [Clostridia bacterium]|nr:hypothetical protein AGMMS49983_19880 [Clostridia bacterium]